ncbi:MAG TPA: 2-oxo acid dehydrogenase subunit E2 [Sphingomonas sp.]|jgi:2-oxoglutarate dehydrogenase E2 component (dihydrolipoamide succinyltransferase)
MTDILVPAQEGTKAIVRAWLRRIGDTVTVNDPLVELETDKVTQEVASPAAGVLTEILLDTDAEAVPGAVLGRLSASVAAAPPVERIAPPPPPARPTTTIALSPSVRRAVQQHALDPASIPGTGRGGRLTRADVDRVIAERAAAPADTNRVPHDRMRLAIARNMLQSVTTAPHVTAVFECDFSAIIAHRNAHKAAFAGQGAKLTFTAYLVAASVRAMAAAPAVNSRWHDDGLEMFASVGVGVGTALGDAGLVVPVVADAQSLSLLGIAARLTDLTARARTGALTPADMRGGTFTISNHGVSGSLLATPIIINQPQSAILGVGKLEKRVVVREVAGVDTIQIRPMCYVSLTIDHRVIDGHQTNAWLTSFVEAIETWPVDG